MKTILQNILKVLSPPERIRLLKLILSDFVVSMLDIVFLVALLYVVSLYMKTAHEPVGLLSAAIFKKYPVLLVTAFFVLYSLKNYAALLISKTQFNFIYKVASRISKEKLIQYLRGNYSEYVETDSSVFLHRIGQQPIEFCHYVLKGSLQICSQVLLLMAALAVIMLFKARLFFLLFVLLAPPIIMVGYLLKRKLHHVRAHVKSTSEKSIQYLQEALSGFVESKIHGREAFFTERYHAQQEKVNKYLSDQQIIQHVPSRLIEVFAIFGLLILVSINLFNGEAALSVITIGTFVTACYKIIPGIVKIMNGIGQVKTYAYTCQELVWLDPDRQSGDWNESTHIHSFELADVSCRFKGVQVLNGFSLKGSRGDFIGLCGASGIGKTTLLNLLLGFVSPLQGSLFINDTENKQVPLYHRNITYVKQQPFIMNDTIRANITLCPHSHDDAWLSEILESTGVSQIVQTSANGLDTVIAEEGRNLSGGQRQRIALARALYKKADLLILDEPFSELDEVSERAIMNYLKSVSAKGKIILLITHNKQMLSFCNKTVSMDGRN